MSLKNAIQDLYPQARNLVDFELARDADGGLSLARWNDALGPRPAIEELSAAEAEADRKAAIRSQIADIERSITPRRLREALLGGDGGWLAAREAEIAALRSQLAGGGP